MVTATKMKKLKDMTEEELQQVIGMDFLDVRESSLIVDKIYIKRLLEFKEEHKNDPPYIGINPIANEPSKQ